jgi:E3 ubiquitin-protein ligase synoviolin
VQLVRLLQGELMRLRAAQINPVTAMGTAVPVPTALPGAAVAPPALATSQMSSSVTQRQFTSNPQLPAIGSGDNRLPEGLTLPPGWSLLPLQRVDQLGQQAGHPIAQPGGPTASFQPTTTLPAALSSNLFSPTANHTQEAGTQHRDNGTAHDSTSAANARPAATSTSITSSPSPTQDEGRPDEVGDSSLSRGLVRNRSPSPQISQTKVTPDGLADQPLIDVGSKSGPESSTGNGQTDGSDNASAGPSDPGSSKGKARAATVEDYIDDGS